MKLLVGEMARVIHNIAFHKYRIIFEHDFIQTLCRIGIARRQKEEEEEEEEEIVAEDCSKP